MRLECPICSSPQRMDNWDMDFAIPDSWTFPEKNKVCCCLACGFVYYDNQGTQEDYDRYYADKYGYGMDGTANYIRLDGIAALITETFQDRKIQVRDFGGGEGYLVRRLNEFGFSDADVWNVGEPVPQGCDLIVASHVLEHIYDIKSMMQDLSKALKPGGYILVEIPDAMGYSWKSSPPLLDYQTKHVNHFSPFHLDLLFNQYRFSVVNQWHPEIKIQNAKCYRALYQADNRMGMWERSRAIVSQNMAIKIQKLQAITTPVIVWGCADTTWHLLTQVPNLPVAYFVDKDSKAYPEGTTIMGIQVYDAIHSNEPIVVMAQGQRQQIFDNIRALGLTNQVIEV
jgi:predicted SAM-dependent methyltransferase